MPYKQPRLGAWRLVPRKLALQSTVRALLPPGIEDRIIIVHDDEPTSIVAYFLSTKYAPRALPLAVL